MSGTGAARMPLIEAPLEFRLRSGGSKTKDHDRAFVTCPKCGAPMFIRRSERLTETVKHLDGHCTNTGCGATGLVEVTFIHLYNPGLIDRPDLDLKLCPRDKIPQVFPPASDGGDDGQISMFDASG